MALYFAESLVFSVHIRFTCTIRHPLHSSTQSSLRGERSVDRLVPINNKEWIDKYFRWVVVFFNCCAFATSICNVVNSMELISFVAWLLNTHRFLLSFSPTPHVDANRFCYLKPRPERSISRYLLNYKTAIQYTDHLFKQMHASKKIIMQKMSTDQYV